jgi:hypothetical protein
MISAQSHDVAEQAKAIYCEQLQQTLEVRHTGEFVAIEPVSGSHFLSDSYTNAVARARAVYPDRLAFVIRIGQPAAVHLGGLTT